MAAALLTGCGGHTHQAAGGWKADLSEHWQICGECGKEMEKGAHTLEEFDLCAVCGTEVVDWGDSKSLYQFNEHDELLRTVDYDESGKVITETIYEYEYDAEGDLLSSSTVTDGVLMDESLYTTVDGERVLSEYTGYLEDGGGTVSHYDGNGNMIRSIFYDAQGNMELQTESEYAQTPDGEWFERVCVTTEADGSRYTAVFSERGDQISSSCHDAQGDLLYRDAWVYTYDADGNWQTTQYYYNDVLTSETVYTTVATEDGSMTYPETVTEYDEDGGMTVTVYDENGQDMSQTYCAAEK